MALQTPTRVTQSDTVAPTMRDALPDLAPVYLDHSATTPLDAEVLEAMYPYLCELHGNPSGAYSAGRKARAALEKSRAGIASLLGCRAAEIVFTSGGTESDNLALRGAALAGRAAGRGRHVVTTAVEHKAVLETCHQLEELGFECTVIGVDSLGRVDPDEVVDAVRDDTVVVSVMLANNEVGTIEPAAEIGRRVGERGAVFHTDAVQAAAWMDLNVDDLSADLLSISAHKLHGPKGVGLLYVRDGTPLWPTQSGGGQEGGRRSGTENVAGIVGLAAAMELGARDRGEVNRRTAQMRDRLIAGVLELPDAILTGHPAERLPGHASFCIGGCAADTVLLGLDMRGICCSSGSACSTGNLSPSYVLTAMGVPDDLARGALRFSMGRHTTAEQIDKTLEALIPLVRRVRQFVTT